MSKQWLGLLVGGIVLLASPLAWAGHPQDRQGFWIGLGGGIGSADASCDQGCEGGNRQDSFSGFAKLGGTLSPRVLLGVEANAWIKDEGGFTLTLGSLTGTATFYPQVSSGFFLKGGVGLSYVDTELRVGELSVGVNKTGWGVLAGLGYDLRVARNVSITPSANFYYGGLGNLSVGGVTFAGWTQNVIDVGIGVTFH